MIKISKCKKKKEMEENVKNNLRKNKSGKGILEQKEE